MKNLILLFMLILTFCQAYYLDANEADLSFLCEQTIDDIPKQQNYLRKTVVIATKRILLNEFPEAFNPSIIKTEFGYLLTFRYCPFKPNDTYSYFGIVRLDDAFNVISTPQLIDARFGNNHIPPQSEDARIFSYNGQLYLMYNDNPEVNMPSIHDRRDLYIAALHESSGYYFLSHSVKLIHEDKYSKVLWQKNWVPFVWNGTLYLSYSISPHEVLNVDLETGICSTVYETSMNFQWPFGSLRGGTPAQLVDGKYFAFFHSSTFTSTYASRGKKMFHYFMGAYTFSPEPPFSLLTITHGPITGKGFYTRSDCDKRVIFPCGYVDAGNLIYVAYGKDDREIWIATIDKISLAKCMVPVN